MAATSTPTQTLMLQVTPAFQASMPPEPKNTLQVTQLTELSVSQQSRDRLICADLLEGKTRKQAKSEAARILDSVLGNTQVLAIYGNDAMDGVNRLNDQMIKNRPEADIPELRDAMKELSRFFRGIGKKYDPSDPKTLKRYQRINSGFRAVFNLGRTFFQEFMDDLKSFDEKFEEVEVTLEGRQDQLLRNVTYYDQYYELNEEEISKLIYTIAVMEILRDMILERANQINVGSSDMGDRGGEEQAKLSELVTFLDNKIISFKARLWVAWATAPQIRNMRAISLGLSARINQTLDVTIPTMKNTIAIWLTLSEAQQTQQLNQAVEDMFNDSLTMFAKAAETAVPVVAASLATPTLDPRTVVAWSASLQAQADGMIEAYETGRQKRLELERAILESKGIVDTTTQRINQAQLDELITAAQEVPLEISRSVPNQD